MKGKIEKIEGRYIVPCGYERVTANRGLNIPALCSVLTGISIANVYIFLPVQLKPFPEYPELQVQLYDPTVLLQ